MEYLIKNISQLRDRIRSGKDFVGRIFADRYFSVDLRDKTMGGWAPFNSVEPDRGHFGFSTQTNYFTGHEVRVYLKKDGNAFLFGYKMRESHGAFPIKKGPIWCELPDRNRIIIPMRKPFENLELFIEMD